MKSSTFLSLYEKLERLVHRLPEALQQPILREITPIKTLFLLQRAPRLCLLGAGAVGKAELINALFGAEALRPGDQNLGDGDWREIGRAGRGTLKVLDARAPVSVKMVKSALASDPPDLFIFIGASGGDGASAADLDQAEKILAASGPESTLRARLLGVAFPRQQGEDGERLRQGLNAALHARGTLSDHMVGTLAMTTPSEIQRLAEVIAVELPGEAQLEMARLSGNQALQSQIARIVVKSITAICAAIGTQPIPLADFPILTSLQATMVAGIMHISGREWSPRLAGEFIAALGANIGAGLVLREGARAAVKLIPIWGNAVSGAVAGAGTYGMGRSAIAYFIEGVSLGDARQIFRKKKTEPTLLRN